MFIKPKNAPTPDEIIREFLDSGYNPVQMERLQTDMLIRYLGPASDVDWQLTPHYANEVLDQWHFIIQMLRQVTDYHQEQEAAKVLTNQNQ